MKVMEYRAEAMFGMVVNMYACSLVYLCDID